MKRLFLGLILILVGCALALADGVPRQANQYRRMLVQSAQMHFGLDAPIALFAGQIHQESAWNPLARSKYASGLAQFTPATAGWISARYPFVLKGANTLSPKWALNAQATYNRYLYDRFGVAASDCDRWAMTLSSYNGGAGNLAKDRVLTIAQGKDAYRWWGNVEHHSVRARWAFIENRDYVRKIIYRWQPLYSSWGVNIICEVKP